MGHLDVKDYVKWWNYVVQHTVVDSDETPQREKQMNDNLPLGESDMNIYTHPAGNDV